MDFSSFNTLLTEIASILKTDGPTFLCNIHEALGSVELTILLSNRITIGHVHSAIKSALYKTAETSVPSINGLQWYAITCTLLDHFEKLTFPPPIGQQIMALPEVQPLNASTQLLVPARSTYCQVATAAISHPAPAPQSAAPRIQLKKAVSADKPKKKATTVVLTPHTAPLKPGVAIKIRRDLNTHIQAATHVLYPALCKRLGCEFCASIARQVNVTTCASIHGKRCNASGWYPHIGPKLVGCLKKPHRIGDKFRPQRTLITDPCNQMLPLRDDEFVPAADIQSSLSQKRRSGSHDSCETVVSRKSKMDCESVGPSSSDEMRSSLNCLRIGECSPRRSSDTWSSASSIVGDETE
jgi:hypothetical protein